MVPVSLFRDLQWTESGNKRLFGFRRCSHCAKKSGTMTVMPLETVPAFAPFLLGIKVSTNGAKLAWREVQLRVGDCPSLGDFAEHEWEGSWQMSSIPIKKENAFS